MLITILAISCSMRGSSTRRSSGFRRRCVSSPIMPRCTTTWAMPARPRGGRRRRSPAIGMLLGTARLRRSLQRSGHCPARTGKARRGCRQLPASSLRLQPDHAEAHNNLGNAFRDQDRFDAAIASFQNACAREARLCRGLQQSGQCAERSGIGRRRHRPIPACLASETRSCGRS